LVHTLLTYSVFIGESADLTGKNLQYVTAFADVFHSGTKTVMIAAAHRIAGIPRTLIAVITIPASAAYTYTVETDIVYRARI
jgi:hypothetical protein